MAIHDFRCRVCGQVLTDINVPIAIGATAGAPFHCGQPAVWLPQIGSMDAFEPGAEFSTYDGQNRPVQIESFAQMRQLERESEQQARNGEGQPLRFRMLHQDRSNREVNTFGSTPEEKPSPEAIRKFKPVPMGEEPAYGPGVHDGNTSALKDQ